MGKNEAYTAPEMCICRNLESTLFVRPPVREAWLLALSKVEFFFFSLIVYVPFIRSAAMFNCTLGFWKVSGWCDHSANTKAREAVLECINQGGKQVQWHGYLA